MTEILRSTRNASGSQCFPTIIYGRRYGETERKLMISLLVAFFSDTGTKRLAAGVGISRDVGFSGMTYDVAAF